MKIIYLILIFSGWEWEDLSEDEEDKGCENGDESFYAESEYTKDTPKQIPKALKNSGGGRLAPTPDDFQVKYAFIHNICTYFIFLNSMPTCSK